MDLPSQQLKQQHREAEQIARENAERKKAGSKDSPKEKTTELPAGREPDLTGGTDQKELRFPANVMMANSSSSLSVGGHYSNQMSVSGVVRRIVLMPGGFYYGAVETSHGLRWIVVFPTGMTSELEP